MVLEHGTRSMYVKGNCRCRMCTTANADWGREYARRIRREAKAFRELAKQIKKADRDV